MDDLIADDTSASAPQCGYIREQWDGPYRMRDRCTAPAGHTQSRMAFDHGPWVMVE